MGALRDALLLGFLATAAHGAMYQENPVDAKTYMADASNLHSELEPNVDVSQRTALVSPLAANSLAHPEHSAQPCGCVTFTSLRPRLQSPPLSTACPVCTSGAGFALVLGGNAIFPCDNHTFVGHCSWLKVEQCRFCSPCRFRLFAFAWCCRRALRSLEQVASHATWPVLSGSSTHGPFAPHLRIRPTGNA